MHMADALLSPGVGAAFWVGALSIIAYCSRKLKDEINEKIIPLMGIMGAFIFAAQMINFTIPGTGSSGHIGGGLLLAIVLGPWAGFITIASVLFIQGLFFADGGLLAMGCNIWNMGVYPCFIAYPLIYKAITNGNCLNKNIMKGSVLGVVLGLELGVFSVVIQTVLSGITELPFLPFISIMFPIHLVIAIMEGIITGAVVIYVKNIQPEILSYANNKTASNNINFKKVILTIGVLAIFTGGILSRFSSTHPDGLEWSIKKVSGVKKSHGEKTGLHKTISGIQEKTSILPDYSFAENDIEDNKNTKTEKGSQFSASLGTTVSGVIGGAFTFSVVILAGLLIKIFRGKGKT